MDEAINGLQQVITEKNEEIERLWNKIKELNDDKQEMHKELVLLKRDYERITRLYMDMSDMYFAASRRLSDYETADRVPRCVR